MSKEYYMLVKAKVIEQAEGVFQIIDSETEYELYADKECTLPVESNWDGKVQINHGHESGSPVKTFKSYGGWAA